MANVIYNGKVVGELLIDPAGTNMGINWADSCDQPTRDAAWNIFFKNYPTGNKIENTDLNLG
jgi:hypothetical protein